MILFFFQVPLVPTSRRRTISPMQKKLRADVREDNGRQLAFRTMQRRQVGRAYGRKRPSTGDDAKREGKGRDLPSLWKVIKGPNVGWKLKRHINSEHEKKALHKCSVCNEAFVYESALRRHKGLAHGEQEQSCIFITLMIWD